MHGKKESVQGETRIKKKITKNVQLQKEKLNQLLINVTVVYYT